MSAGMFMAVHMVGAFALTYLGLQWGKRQSWRAAEAFWGKEADGALDTAHEERMKNVRLAVYIGELEERIDRFNGC